MDAESGDKGGTGADSGHKNPLFEGNKENMQRMGLLFPAVALGVLLSAAD